ncbi:unnamed protein product [Sphagnum troendelagicum]|uniref:Uncharacterized protein n=1 Tax=Sphagnum troendelagicum TaxID=128251 RepID=A0ABP0TLA6_9BRYO
MMVFFCFMAVHNGFMKVPFTLSPSSSGHGEARTHHSCREELLSPEELGLLLLLLLIFLLQFRVEKSGPERWCQKRDLASWAQHLLPATKTGPSLGQKLIVEKLWWEFFSDPSQWWDNRVEKAN